MNRTLIYSLIATYLGSRLHDLPVLRSLRAEMYFHCEWDELLRPYLPIYRSYHKFLLWQHDSAKVAACEIDSCSYIAGNDEIISFQNYEEYLEIWESTSTEPLRASTSAYLARASVLPCSNDSQCGDRV